MFRKAAPFVICLIMVLSLMGSASAQERPDAPPYGMPGPYAVGTMELVLDNQGRELPITVWYPAVPAEGDSVPTSYSLGIADLFGPDLDIAPGHAMPDADPDLSGAPYPLVVNSHGTGGTRLLHIFYLEHLASYGFVVMAPEHVGTAIRDNLLAPEGAELIWGLPAMDFVAGHFLRPSDMVAAIDFADDLTSADGRLAGMISTEKTAFSGYSGGGYTALAAAGARLDFEALAAWCGQAGNSQETSPGYALSCPLLPYEGALADLFGGEAGELWPPVTDERVATVIAFAPGRIPAFGPEGLSASTVPAMILTGSADVVDWQDDNAYAAYEHLGSDERALVVFDYGGHSLFGECPAAWTSLMFASCADAVWDMDRAHDLTNHFATAFLLAHLYDDAEAAAALAPDAVNFPGITYETTVQ